ncbi:hypothetical protein [Hymenobacter siberiensis]|uniref:hypothetical protein n=1 Tax=Hymenobacter siberiensis TaxID=2848396 RepID=UPI001C1E5744|nr:hypothetical protein [Hymenobacter siberiensis]MBU6122592.1 hypothetical protein [Hymenobacter siberiensis]
MKPDTSAANALLQQALMGAAVESFGLYHQIPMLEFRNDRTQDHRLYIDTEMSSNVGFDPALALTEDEKMLVIFNRINLRYVTRVACDDHANLLLEFDNGMHLRFTGTPQEATSEPWQVASRTSLNEPGGYMVIATYDGGYAIWDAAAAP